MVSDITKQLILSIILFVIGVIVFLMGFKSMKKYRLIKDTPTSKIRSMAMGLVELHARVADALPCKAPFSNTPCAYYSFKVEEYRRHVTSDSKGRTSVHYSWDVVQRGKSSTPFLIEDDSGKTYLNPKDIDEDILLRKTLYQPRKAFQAFTALKRFFLGKTNDSLELQAEIIQEVPLGKFRQIGRFQREGDRRYFEYLLFPKDPLYILGTATNDSSIQGGVVVQKGNNDKTFCMSMKTEEQMLRHEMKMMLLTFLSGSILIIISIVLLVQVLGMM